MTDLYSLKTDLDLETTLFKNQEIKYFLTMLKYSSKILLEEI